MQKFILLTHLSSISVWADNALDACRQARESGYIVLACQEQ